MLIKPLPSHVFRQKTTQFKNNASTSILKLQRNNNAAAPDESNPYGDGSGRVLTRCATDHTSSNQFTE